MARPKPGSPLDSGPRKGCPPRLPPSGYPMLKTGWKDSVWLALCIN